MQDAVDSDRASNEAGKPAVKRLMVAQDVYRQLRKSNIQEKFLEFGGCRVFSEWLDQMPDGTFPNVNLVSGILTCIDGLRIDIGHLEESKLGQVVQCYSEGLANMPYVQNLAKRLVDKWSRLVHNIKSHYDFDGECDDEYRVLQKRLNKIRANRDGDSDVDEPKPSSASKNDLIYNPQVGRI